MDPRGNGVGRSVRRIPVKLQALHLSKKTHIRKSPGPVHQGLPLLPLVSISSIDFTVVIATVLIDKVTLAFGVLIDYLLVEE